MLTVRNDEIIIASYPFIIVCSFIRQDRLLVLHTVYLWLLLNLITRKLLLALPLLTLWMSGSQILISTHISLETVCKSPKFANFSKPFWPMFAKNISVLAQLPKWPKNKNSVPQKPINAELNILTGIDPQFWLLNCFLLSLIKVFKISSLSSNEFIYWG